MNSQPVFQTSKHRIEIIDEATYEVVSNYIGSVSLLDLFKQMVKRDLERLGGLEVA